MKCCVDHCARAVQHARIPRFAFIGHKATDPVAEPDYADHFCDVHAKERMRCESNNVDAAGECWWCNAANGESCRKRK